MYYDKQTDNHFLLIAFNHEQIKHSMTGGFFLVETLHFHLMVVLCIKHVLRVDEKHSGLYGLRSPLQA